MEYTGRMLGVIIMLITIIVIRTYAYLYLNYPLTALPIPGIFALSLVYWIGKKYDQVKFYSEKDSLTGLYNRRIIDSISSSVLIQATKKNEKLGILLFDCNNFKIINDTYGHATGDLVLQEFARLLLTETKKTDIVARWGGDEFLMIVSNADESSLKIIINRIEVKLQELSRKLQFPISASSGFSMYPKNGDRLDDLLIAADNMLYSSKVLIRYPIRKQG